MKKIENILGATIGDIVGSRFEFKNFRSKNFEIPKRANNNYFFTDDTVLTVAIADILLNEEQNDRQKIIEKIRMYGRKYPSSYGLSFNNWLYSSNPQPYNSFGNGSAMRISPVAWFANSEEEVKELSREVTEVTHNHPEGLKGAEVTAMCIYYARIGKSKGFIKQYAEQYYNLDFDYEDLKKNYFFNETCQQTVPQAIYCFLISNSFEDCLRTSVSIGGDTDTLCAISCAIASAYYDSKDDKITKNIFNSFLPLEFKKVLKAFWKKVEDKHYGKRGK